MKYLGICAALALLAAAHPALAAKEREENAYITGKARTVAGNVRTSAAAGWGHATHSSAYAASSLRGASSAPVTTTAISAHTNAYPPLWNGISGSTTQR
ncbi:MAG: hypothetical protein JO089_03915 [Alphaproteobacteria bacterium]|nr:hypothetical protein [Alphaproteobacteria bacterium]